MSAIVRWGLRLSALLLATGCASMPASAPKTTTSRAALRSARGIVFCADGAGGFGWTTEALAGTAAEERIPIHVEFVDWSHGWGRMIIDNCHWSHTQEQGRRLADMVKVAREEYPHLPIYLIGHSAGCAVALEAARYLPPDSVERIVLLAPSVSPTYDLRPALLCSRKGVDNFTSRYDWLTLGITMCVFGTTDRRWTVGAGRVGFCRPDPRSKDAALYAKLHEHEWEPSQTATGHRGGHYGSYVPGFLKAKVLPLLNPDADISTAR
jgi:pimeloyl-ACP methyl ester carboxylesterase